MTNVHGIHVQGASFPAQIWHGYMVAALKGHSSRFTSSTASWPMHP